jgi:hypothetical protein
MLMLVLLKFVFPSTPVTPVQQSLKIKEPQQIRSQLKDEQPLQALVENQRRLAADQADVLKNVQQEVQALRAESKEARQELKNYKEQSAEKEARLRDQFNKEVAAARKRASENASKTAAATQTVKVDPARTAPSLLTPSTPFAPNGRFKLETLDAKPLTTPTPLPPVGGYEETAYLSIGCHAQIKFVSGTLASSHAGEEYFNDYVLFTINQTFHCPMRLGMPGALPTPTGIDAAGCLGLARAKADLAKGRVQMRAEYLSCVGPDGAAYEPQIKGFVLDEDGTQGVVGELISYESAKVGKAFIAGLIQEASAAFGLAKSQIVVTDRGLGGSQFPGAASQSIIQQIATYWLTQAQALQPVLWVHAGGKGYLVLQQGLPLHGYPVAALVKGVS